VWVERWITKKIREQEMLSVFVLEMWDTKLRITDAQQEGNNAGNVMGQYIWWGSMLNREEAGKRRRRVEDKEQQSDGYECAFGISDESNVSSDDKIFVKIGGLPVTMIIDSGASCNVIVRNVWEYLKANKVKCVSSKASKKLYSCGSNQPLQIANIFIAEVSVGGRVLSGVEFFVIENKGQALLGRETAIALGVARLESPVRVNSLEASTD